MCQCSCVLLHSQFHLVVLVSDLTYQVPCNFRDLFEYCDSRQCLVDGELLVDLEDVFITHVSFDDLFGVFTSGHEVAQ